MATNTNTVNAQSDFIVTVHLTIDEAIACRQGLQRQVRQAKEHVAHWQKCAQESTNTAEDVARYTSYVEFWMNEVANAERAIAKINGL